MLSRTEGVNLMRDLVDAVDEYRLVDEEWAHVETRQAKQHRDKMYAIAQRIMLAMCGCSLNTNEINEVFSWQWED